MTHWTSYLYWSFWKWNFFLGSAVFVAAGVLQWVDNKATPQSVVEANGCGDQGCLTFFAAVYFIFVTVSSLLICVSSPPSFSWWISLRLAAIFFNTEGLSFFIITLSYTISYHYVHCTNLHQNLQPYKCFISCLISLGWCATDFHSRVWGHYTEIQLGKGSCHLCNTWSCYHFASSNQPNSTACISQVLMYIASCSSLQLLHIWDFLLHGTVLLKSACVNKVCSRFVAHFNVNLHAMDFGNDFVGVAYEGKDIVLRFLIEYSGLRD